MEELGNIKSGTETVNHFDDNTEISELKEKLFKTTVQNERHH